ncbi:MAG TPA: DUF5996 family protein [Terriglobales bacterium]|nr:DUF5996 family protein [Terriglobales bacterium]
MALESGASSSELWPELHLRDWRDTCDTLHMWTQIVGKIRTALTPPINHWWHSTLYITPRGLTTSSIPDNMGGLFDLEFDFIDDRLRAHSGSGAVHSIPLSARPVCDFYGEVMRMLRSMGIEVRIWTMPQEFPDPIPFEKDETHASYDPEYVRRFHRVLTSVSRVLAEFRSGFIGKCSPVHFFWGSFDLAITRFSGRLAPERPDADPVTREAYSHECSSAGWWPGGGPVDDAAFYAYTAPAPEGYGTARVLPPGARFLPDFGEFVLMYDDVRRSSDPEQVLMEFLQTTYEAGANLGNWDRSALERPEGATLRKTA